MDKFNMRDELGGIGVTEEQIELGNAAEAFCRDNSPIDKVRTLIEAQTSYEPEVWNEMSTLGWLGITIPEDLGGIGLSLADVVPIVEQMGRFLMSGPFISSTLAAELIKVGGSGAQQSLWLPQLAAGTIASLALYEPGNGFDANLTFTTAKRSGDLISLSGTKIMVTDADTADLLIVSIIFDGKPTFVIVPSEQLVESAMRRETVIDETRGSYEISFDGVSVPAENLLPAEQNSKARQYVHLAWNLLLAAEMCGGTQSCLEYTNEYLKTRKQFGKQIGAFQALKHTMADAYCEYEKAKSHLYSAAWCLNSSEHWEIAVRMAKAQADKAFSFAADRAIQFHGGFGFTYDCDAQLYRRRAMWCATQHGDADFHKRKLGQLLFA